MELFGKTVPAILILIILLIGVGIGFSLSPFKVLTETVREPVLMTVTETAWKTVTHSLTTTVEHTLYLTATKMVTTETTITVAGETASTFRATESSMGTLPPPGKLGYENLGGKAKVTIINDSPYRLRILLKGPESREILIDKCEICTEYLFVGPLVCPTSSRPKAEILLEPGTYDVLVSTAEPSGILPCVGSWTLDPNTLYGFCYFVVKRYS